MGQLRELKEKHGRCSKPVWVLLTDQMLSPSLGQVCQSGGLSLAYRTKCLQHSECSMMDPTYCSLLLHMPAQGIIYPEIPDTPHNFLPPCFCLFIYFRAVPKAYGISQARGRIGAAAASLHHSHSNAGSQDLSNICDLHHSSQQRRQILNPLIEAGDGTCVIMYTSWVR